MAKLKAVVKVKDKDGQEVELAVKAPSALLKQKAKKEYLRSWNEAVTNGAMIAECLETHLRDQKIWDDVKQARFDEIRKFILDGELKLSTGGVRLSEMREIALEMSRKRGELNDLLSVRQRIERNTAESKANQDEFNFLVAHCTVYNDGPNENKPYFTRDGVNPSLEAYLERCEEPAAFLIAGKLSELLYGTDMEAINKLPEIQFLKKYKFANENGHLIDKQGRLVDTQGRLVNEDGRYINEEGKLVDIDGNLVDEEGKRIVEFKPFLDDEGNPIVEEGNASPAPTE